MNSDVFLREDFCGSEGHFRDPGENFTFAHYKKHKILNIPGWGHFNVAGRNIPLGHSEFNIGRGGLRDKCPFVKRTCLPHRRNQNLTFVREDILT